MEDAITKGMGYNLKVNHSINFMDNKKIVFKDEIQIDDRPLVKGVVVLRDDNGKIIFKKNNMIVNAGRKYLQKLFFQSISTRAQPTLYSTNVNVIVGTGSSVTTASMTKDNFENAVELVSSKSTNNTFITESNENDEPYLIFKLKVRGEGTTAFNMSELGIVLDYKLDPNDADTTSNLFSRIVFDPLPFTSSNSYDLDYYMYF